MALGEVDRALGIATVGISTADSLWHRGVILTDLGRLQDAAAAFQRADERARRFGENEMASWIDFWRANTLERAGDASGALSMARRAIESAEKIGSVLGRICAHGSHGMACVLAEQWQSARESLDFALELGRAEQAGLFLEPYYMTALARRIGSSARWARRGMPGDRNPVPDSVNDFTAPARRLADAGIAPDRSLLWIATWNDG